MKYKIALLLILIVPFVTAIEITEIHYNPEESQEYNLEYVEVYTDLNLSGFTIQDLGANDTLEQVKYTLSTHALIVGTGFNHTDINATVYVVENAKIGNGLNNDEDLITIRNNTEIIDSTHYYAEWGGNNNGKTICKINNIWEECPQTPGEENIIHPTTTEITINEFLPNPEGDDNAPMPRGEWIELYNAGDETDLSNYKIKDNSGKTLIISGQNTNTTIIQQNSYLVVYANGFSGLLNNEGYEKIALVDFEDNILDEISYSHTQEGNSISQKDNTWVLTVPSPGQENFGEEEKKDSKIKIQKVYKDKIQFGDTFTFRVEVYKGDTSKETIEAYVEDKGTKISKTSKVNLNKRFENYTITIPIQLDSNCNEKLKNKDYKLIIQGLNTKDQEFIPINGINKDNCEIIKESCSEQTINSFSNSENNINEPICSNKSTVYESKNTVAKRSALILFSLILVLIILKQRTENGNKSKHNNRNRRNPQRPH